MHGFKDFLIALEASGSGTININTKYLVGSDTEPGFFAGLKQGAKKGWEIGQEGNFTQAVEDELKTLPKELQPYSDKLKKAFDWACEYYKKYEDKILNFKAIGIPLYIDLRYIIYILVAVYFGGLTGAKSVSIPYSYMKWYAMWYFGEKIESKLDATIQKKLNKNSSENDQNPTNEIFSPALRNKVGYALGYGAGFIGGETKKAISKISNFIKNNKNYFIQLAKDAGIKLAKVLLITTLVTFGSQAYNIGFGILDTALDTIIKSNVLSQEQIVALMEYIRDHLPDLDKAVDSQGLIDKMRAYFGNFLTKIPLVRVGWLGADTAMGYGPK